MKWTDEQTASLTDKWNDGWSASQIGGHLGVTRNAVIGKLNRISGYKTAKRVKLVKALNTVKTVVDAPSITGGISLYDLTNVTCRWPTSPGYFCGTTTAKQPYCLEHTNAARRS